jgi:hypothetical protein
MDTRTQEEIEYDDLLSEIRSLIKTKPGKDFIWYILGLCDIYEEQFTGNSRTFFNEGKRSIGIQILEILGEAEPLAYAELLAAKIKEQQGAKDD